MKKVIEKPPIVETRYVSDTDCGRIYVLDTKTGGLFRLIEAGGWGRFLWVDVYTSYKTWMAQGHGSFKNAIHDALAAGDNVMEFESVAEYALWLHRRPPVQGETI
ncbi:MAG TPA: hypothetical protein VMW24_09475 [Sedimentisphaerales bacterium]|nr:hypothetical protein [Sedimentisphaerales bacterium]